MSPIRIISVRRAAPAALVVGMLLTLLPAATFAAPPPSVLDAEVAVLAEINQVRANHDLAPLRMTTGVRFVARDRSVSMKQHDYFDHVSPGGTDAADLLNRRDISYRYWGEIIGWTVNMGLGEGARWMVDWWKHSPVHRDIMLSRAYNYAGVGIAVEGNTVLWTVVFVNQADHTPPVASLVQRASTASLRVADTNQSVVRWWGRDRRLAVRTAGLDSFIVQHRLPGGRWDTLLNRTTARQATWNLRPGLHFFRVRARDNMGNVGRWQGPTRVYVARRAER
jgi:uncharacterized protein YkwD